MKLNENNQGTQIFTVDQVLAMGAERFGGAPDTGFVGGPAFSPTLDEALAHSGSMVDRGTRLADGRRPEMPAASPRGVAPDIAALFKEGK